MRQIAINRAPALDCNVCYATSGMEFHNKREAITRPVAGDAMCKYAGATVESIVDLPAVGRVEAHAPLSVGDDDNGAFE